MSKMKKVLLMCTAYVLVAALAIGGTIAYLQDSDSDVNVMTLGNVSIEQLEYQRAEGVDHINPGAKKGDLVPFVQGQTLYPAVPANNAVEDYSAENGDTSRYFYWGEYAPGANGLWNDDLVSNVMDKFVFVKNTGKTDAYYRTVFAFECPEGMMFGQAPEQDDIERELMMNTNSYSAFTWDDLGYTVIGGTRYKLMVANYANVLKPNETSRPSLLQVLLTHKATNEDMELLGDTYEILVLSQAVQAAGFADAKTALNTGFGVVNADSAAEWFSGEAFAIPATVASADELVEALENGKDVVLTESVKIDPAKMSNAYGKTGINVKNGQTIDGNGNTIDIKGAGGTWDSGINTTGGTIKNLTVTGSFRGIFINHNSDHSEPVILENVTIEGTTYTISCDQGMNQTLTATDSAFKGWTSFAATLGEATFIDCYFGEGNGYAYCRPYAPTTFVGCDFEAGYELDARAAVTFENCTIGGVALTADNLATLVTSNIANASVK